MAASNHGSGLGLTGGPHERPESTPVVVTTMGTSGGVYPFLACAEALARRGHPVSFLGPAAHEEAARRAGLTFHSILSREEYGTLVGNPDLWSPTRSLPVIWGTFRKLMDRIPAFFATLPKDQRHILLCHPLLLTAATLVRAERPDLRIVAAFFSPSHLRTVHDPLLIGPMRVPGWVPKGLRRWLWGQIDRRLIDPVALPDYNAARQARGLEPISRGFVNYLHEVPDLSVTFFPPWFADRQPDWPHTHIGYFPLYDPNPDLAATPELERFLSAGEPPIVFTPGTGALFSGPYFESALQTVRMLGRRAIFLTLHREHVPRDLPDTILWQEYMPFRSLLPRVSVLVHHGGIGTIGEALRCGVPQVVVATAHDQFDNGARMEALGTGRWLPNTKLRPDRLAAILRELLASETVRERCRAVAARFEQDWGQEAFMRAIETA